VRGPRLTRIVERSIGTRFVEAVAAQDESAIAACLAPGVEFRALVPPGLRECTGAEEVAALVAGWFADSAEFDLVESRADAIGDRLHLTYRFEGVENGDAYIVEQHLYYTVAGEVIERADLICSGFRPRVRE
jgi:SnoaL-like domain